MDSMYERLMCLPLFKGAGRDMIHAIAEKIPLDFTIYQPGQTIIKERAACSSVMCLVSGSIICEHHLFHDTLTIRERFESGGVIAVEHLFGLDTTVGMNVKADTRCGIMQFPKKQYMQLLQSNHLLLLNYLNYICKRAQLSENALKRHHMRSILSELAFLIEISTCSSARDIELECSSLPLAEILGGGSSDGYAALRELHNSGHIHIISDYKIKITSRQDLLDIFGDNI